MTQRPWHPYAPDQAFGSQVARDQELVDKLVDRLDDYRRLTPRAGNKAFPTGQLSGSARWQLSDRQLTWIISQGAELPVTSAVVLETGPPNEGS